MIRIAITQAAFDAIAATLPLGSVELRERGQRAGRTIRLAPAQCGRPAKGPAPTRRELQRRDPAAGVGRGLDLVFKDRGLKPLSELTRIP